VKPNDKYRVKDFASIVSNLDQLSIFEKKAAKLIPSLLSTYLAIGAQICGEPAYDREFKCMDYLTIIDVEAINQRFIGKLFGTC
jgi:putative hemolysin